MDRGFDGHGDIFLLFGRPECPERVFTAVQLDDMI